MKEVSLKEWLDFVLLFKGVFNTEPDCITLAQHAPGYGIVAKVTYHIGDAKTYQIDESKNPQ
jgi:hypothetical protein